VEVDKKKHEQIDSNELLNGECKSDIKYDDVKIAEVDKKEQIGYQESIDQPDEFRKEIKYALVKESENAQGIRFCDSIKEESLRKVTKTRLSDGGMFKHENDISEARVNGECDDDAPRDAGDDDMLASSMTSMNFRFACLSETCEKMFLKWKPCKKHILNCCGIASTKQNQKELANRSTVKAREQGAVSRREFSRQKREEKKLKRVLTPKKSAGPSEEELVKAVEQFYVSLDNPVSRKHVLGHIRKLYGKGEFKIFGFGTFVEFSKMHGLKVYGYEQNDRILESKEFAFKIIQTIIAKKKSPLGKFNFFCISCGCDLNPNPNSQEHDKSKRKQVREHIQMLHPDIFGEISEQIGPGKVTHVVDIIEQSLKGNFGNDMFAQQRSMKKVNESAKEDILTRLCEVFFRTENIYHCILCDNKLIGRAKQDARRHLASNHVKEEQEMKLFIQEKYDQFVNANFETFLRLVMHKVETF